MSASINTPMRDSDDRVLTLLRAAQASVTIDEITAVYGEVTRWKVRKCLSRLRLRGHDISKVKAGRNGYRDMWLYFLTVPRAPKLQAEPSIRSTPSKVLGISVAWLSCLDAEAAAQGGGAGR